ncbi:MAG: Crp/Fnr family transcriptional regulator [Polyangiaceae bacterium]|nr:Crp/Fnr family transcriptional regulator [Polyangiaceae bacterium]
MKSEFDGPEGSPERERLVEALLRSEAIRSHRGLANRVAADLKLKDYNVGDYLISQGAYDNDMGFILRGSVQVVVNGRVVATRTIGDHVGEMAAIDPRAGRSASIVAQKPTVIGWLEEQHLKRLGDAFPTIWRTLAAALGERLRQRGLRESVRGLTPRVLFVGRSDGPMAQGLVSGLGADVVVHWCRKSPPSTAPLDELLRELESLDFAVIEGQAEGSFDSGGVETIFVLGVVVGALGRSRECWTSRLADKLHLLNGFTAVEVEASSDDEIGRICRKMQELGPR